MPAGNPAAYADLPPEIQASLLGGAAASSNAATGAGAAGGNLGLLMAALQGGAAVSEFDAAFSDPLHMVDIRALGPELFAQDRGIPVEEVFRRFPEFAPRGSVERFPAGDTIRDRPSVNPFGAAAEALQPEPAKLPHPMHGFLM